MAKKRNAIDREIKAAMELDDEVLEEFCEWAYSVTWIDYLTDDDCTVCITVEDLRRVAEAIERRL